MKRINYLLTGVLVMLISCFQSGEKAAPFVNNKLNAAWLKQIIKESDSVYSKPYARRDFATATYYINRKDSTICQVMRDSAKEVRQIMIEKNNIRTFYAQYYPGGQASGIWQLNERGQLEGEAIQFYSNGNIMSKGYYANGLYSGDWEYYDEKQRLVKTERYDSNGSVAETTTY